MIDTVEYLAAEIERLRKENAALREALSVLRSQCKLLGTPDDAVNNQALAMADAALAAAGWEGE